MFCQKCGAKAIDGAEFCQKCGAKLVVDNTVQPTPVSPVQQTQSQPTDQPAKKKSKKLPLILGAVVLVVAAIIFIVLNWKGKIDYVANVRSYTPYANSQGLPYTCGEVLDKYILDAEWIAREEGNNAAFVNISGTVKGLDAEIEIALRVAVKDDQFLLKSISVKLNGEEASENVFFAFFAAYDEKLDDFSSLGQLLNDEVELTETYSDETEGFSFQYPDQWTPNDMIEVDPNAKDSTGFWQICMVAQYSPFASINIYKNTDPQYADLVFASEDSFVSAFNYNIDAVSELGVSSTELGGQQARKVSYIALDENAVQSYFYVNGTTVYRVDFTCSRDNARFNEGLFQAIADSYTITSNKSSEFPLTVSTQAQELIEEWAAAHPVNFDYYVRLASDDWVDADGNSAFLFDVVSSGTMVFMISVQKSDGYMKYIYSRGGEEGLNDWYSEHYGGETFGVDLCYKNESLTNWIGGTAEDAYNTFGWPDFGTVISGELYNGGEYFSYGGAVAFFVDPNTNKISCISAMPDAVDVNGATLNKTRDDLIAILGTPASEGRYEDWLDDTTCYRMEYYINGTEVDIDMPDSTSEAETINIWPN